MMVHFFAFAVVVLDELPSDVTVVVCPPDMVIDLVIGAYPVFEIVTVAVPVGSPVSE
jgi:hypothetical protein